MDKTYSWTELNKLGASLPEPQSGQSRDINPADFPPALRDCLAHDGFDLGKPITIFKAPPPIVDAYVLSQD